MSAAAVLAVLTDKPAHLWARVVERMEIAALCDRGVRVRLPGTDPRNRTPVEQLPVTPWAVESPAEGVEVLATRGLWPWPVGDDAAPRWWCEQCGGSGLDPRVGLYRKPCTERCDWGTANDPPLLAALVAVASLGAPTLLRAEELARVLVGRAPRVVWRAMSREVLREWVDGGAGRPVAEAPQTIPQAACVAAARGGWDGPSPWWLHDAPDDVAAAWPAVRDLAAIGLHVVALDGDRVTLAVEAL